LKIIMSDRQTESKRLLSHTIAEGACSRRYEHLSPEAIQATKLLWFDSIGCALGGSQQDDALLAHYRAAGGDNGAAAAFAGAVFVTTGHGDVLVRRAPPESNVLNLQLR
jgi:2-methylcitrate dehydratase PrpD